MKKVLWLLCWTLLVGCVATPVEEIGVQGLAASGSVTLVNGVSQFVSADLGAGTTVIPARVQPGGSMVGILTVLENTRVNLPASQGGGFKVTALAGSGVVQIHDLSVVSWTTYSANAGGPVAFPQNPRPSGVSAFISTDVSASNVIEAVHVDQRSWGCFGWTLDAVGRQSAPAAQGGGFQIVSHKPNGTVSTCDTSSFRWAVH